MIREGIGINMQRITICKNGPVNSISFEIKKIGLIIGEQATGKSTIAKSVYFCRYVKTLISNYIIQRMETNSYDNIELDEKGRFFNDIKGNLRSIFIELFGQSWELDPKFYIKYEFTDDIWFEVRVGDHTDTGKQYISEYYSEMLRERVKGLINEAVEMYENSQNNHLSLELESESRMRNRKYIIQEVNTIFDDYMTTYYIPAGRSLLTILSSSRATMNSLQNIDFVMNKFMELIDGIRGAYKNGVSNAHRYYPDGNRGYNVREISGQIIRMQKGEYCNSTYGEVLKVNTDRGEEEIKINFSSSGQQEILWLLNFIYVLMLRKEKAFVIIEEPEAHIYPTLQKEIIEFIVQFTNYTGGNALITTHSPYILTALNNMYFAGIIAKNDRAGRKIDGLIDRNHMVLYGDLLAIKLLNNSDDGYYDLLKDDEDEISSYMIDDVSEKINEVYTSLFKVKEEE